MKRALFFCSLLVLALVAAACGGENSDRDQALVDAFVADILGEADPFTQDRDEAICVGEGTYDAFGGDRLAELGITVDSPDPDDADITRAEAEGLIDVIFGCVDMKASFASSIEGGGVSSDQARCVADEIGDDGLKTILADAMVADDDAGPSAEFIATFTAAADGCGVVFGG